MTTFHNLSGRVNGGYTTFGSFWRKDELLPDDAQFAVRWSTGSTAAAQTRVTAYWPNGRVKSAVHTVDTRQAAPTLTLLHEARSVDGIQIKDVGDSYIVDTGPLRIRIPQSTVGHPADYLFCNAEDRKTATIQSAVPVLLLDEVQAEATTTRAYRGRVTAVTQETAGPLACVFKLTGQHYNSARKRSAMPFTTRLSFYFNSSEIKIEHTFFFDGDESKDYLKGMGIQYAVPLAGPSYQHLIQLMTDHGVLTEAAALLKTWHPKLPESVYADQLAGKMITYPAGSLAAQAADDVPVWNHYMLAQNNEYGYTIDKRTERRLSPVHALTGKRTLGAMTVCGPAGGAMFSTRNFWQKSPAAYEVNDLGQECATVTSWFYSPTAEHFDFGHYADRSYPQSEYEGFADVRATAYGVAVTSEASIRMVDELPQPEELEQFAEWVQKPAVFVADPDYYHDRQVMGAWSLPNRNSPMKNWLEQQLAQAFAFYRDEVDQRGWYGLFNYGDIMHSYDAIRHMWRYDMGGYAWQNTELVPTYWLWLYFLRTGRGDVFDMAEAMTRHTSDVDMYHFGPIKGIGSRHNVAHWGCSCKEPRISMAGHHRPYYYLTGDLRVGEAMADSADAAQSMITVPYFMREMPAQVEETTELRTGPDWISLISDWLTAYERTLDDQYRTKIVNGLTDLAAAPLGLASGPNFGFEPTTGHLIYLGEQDEAINTHLQVSMGGTETFIELARHFDNPQWQQMIVVLGRLFAMTPAERTAATGGLIQKRSFDFPFFSSGLSAYAAHMTDDQRMAERLWLRLLTALIDHNDTTGFAARTYAHTVDGQPLQEIPWISSNFTAQWCLNVIICLDLIGEALPATFSEIQEKIEPEVVSPLHGA